MVGNSARGVLVVLTMVVSLWHTACAVGEPLAKPYEEYEPSGILSTSTTSGVVPCDDTNVNAQAMEYWCGSRFCHGDSGDNNGAAPLWLFSDTRATDLLDLPATWQGCTTELVVNTTTPENSLILTAMRHTAPAACGIKMPKGGLAMPPADHSCIEQWVYGLIAAAD